MSEIILLAVIGFLLVERYFFGKMTAKQQKDMLRIMKAKNLEEVTHAEIVDQTKPSRSEPTISEFLPAEAIDDALFDKMIKEQNGRN